MNLDTKIIKEKHNLFILTVKGLEEGTLTHSFKKEFKSYEDAFNYMIRYLLCKF